MLIGKCPAKMISNLTVNVDFLFRLHVRRTDKIGIEASYHAIDEYMKWAELYYDRLELKTEVKQRRVFIATDDMNTVNEAQRK